MGLPFSKLRNKLFPTRAFLLLIRLISLLPLSILRLMICIFAFPLSYIIALKDSPMDGLLRKIIAQTASKKSCYQIKRISYQNAISNCLELPWLYLNKKLSIDNFVIVVGEEILSKINKEPYLFISGHFGAWEVLPVFLTILGFTGNGLYREGRHKWVNDLLQIRNARPPFVGIPGGVKGVHKIINRLDKKEFSYMLFDQVPKKGHGDWVDFFGESAYTMSLASKITTLKKLSNKKINTIFVKTLRDTNGYKIYFYDLSDKINNITESSKRSKIFNEKLEEVICDNPEYYLWFYSRFRKPT